MKKILLLAAITTSLASISLASANDKIVYGGGQLKSSTYSAKYVPAVISVLDNNRLAGYQWGGPTAGTLENVEKIKANPTHLAVGQYDMLKKMSGINIIHSDIGPECLYMITKEDNYDNLGHVLGNAWDLTVITGGLKSGSFGTWSELQATYKDFSDMPITHVDNTLDIVNNVANASDPSIGFFVMRPDPNSTVFEEIEKRKLSIIPVVDFELEENYKFFDLKVAHTGLLGLGKGKSIETACTSVSLFTGVTDNLEGRQLKRLENTIGRLKEADAKLFTPSTKDFRDMFASMTEVSKDRISELALSVKETVTEGVKEVSEKVKQQ